MVDTGKGHRGAESWHRRNEKVVDVNSRGNVTLSRSLVIPQAAKIARRSNYAQKKNRKRSWVFGKNGFAESR